MRKMVKVAAIVGGVFSVIAALLSTVSILSLLQIHAPAANYIHTVAAVLLTILLAVVLFRGKADTFAGIICLTHVMLHLSGAISNIASITAYLGMDMGTVAAFGGVNFLAALMKAAAFVQMALLCFRRQAGKSMPCILTAVVAAVLAVISSVGVNMATIISQTGFDPVVVVSGVSAFFGAVVGVMPFVMAGIAIGCSQAEAPAVNYGVYGYPYQQPQQYWDPQQPEQN